MKINLDWIRGALDRNSKRDKRIVGFKFNIRVGPLDSKDYRDFQVQEAIYIPTNERDRIQQDLAEEMGLRVENGMVIDIFWILIDGERPHMISFLVESKLPWKVMLGKQAMTDLLLEKQLEGAMRVEVDKLFDDSKRRANTWEKVNKRVRRKTSTWVSKSERKNSFRGPSSLQQGVPLQPLTKNISTAWHATPKTSNMYTLPQSPRNDGDQISNDPKYQNDETSRGDPHVFGKMQNLDTTAPAVDGWREGESLDLIGKRLDCEGRDDREGNVADAAICIDQECVPPIPVNGWTKPLISKSDRKLFPTPRPGETSQSEVIGHYSLGMEIGESLLGADTNAVVKDSRRDENPDIRPQNRSKYILNTNEKFLDSSVDNLSENHLLQHNTDFLEHLRDREAGRAKINAQRRGKAPKIRRVKLDEHQIAQSLDSGSATETEEQWTYDSSAKAHYYVDSDTGSRIWYEDSESEDVDP